MTKAEKAAATVAVTKDSLVQKRLDGGYPAGAAGFSALFADLVKNGFTLNETEIRNLAGSDKFPHGRPTAEARAEGVKVKILANAKVQQMLAAVQDKLDAVPDKDRKAYIANVGKRDALDVQIASLREERKAEDKRCGLFELGMAVPLVTIRLTGEDTDRDIPGFVALKDGKLTPSVGRQTGGASQQLENGKEYAITFKDVDCVLTVSSDGLGFYVSEPAEAKGSYTSPSAAAAAVVAHITDKDVKDVSRNGRTFWRKKS